MPHIERARTQAERLDQVGYAHPAYERVALRGILHALLALHEQNEPIGATKPTPRKTATKGANK